MAADQDKVQVDDLLEFETWALAPTSDAALLAALAHFCLLFKMIYN